MVVVLRSLINLSSNTTGTNNQDASTKADLKVNKKCFESVIKN